MMRYLRKAVLSCLRNTLVLSRYQNLDWRDHKNWNCNANSSPYKAGHYDGIDIDPLEVLFVKVCSLYLSQQQQCM